MFIATAVMVGVAAITSITSAVTGIIAEVE